MNRHSPALLLAVIAITAASSCKNSSNNAEAWAELSLSRAALESGSITDARNHIDSLRSKYPTAFNAREDALILLDSIEIANAKVELEALQQKIANTELDRIGLDTMNFYLDEAKEKVRFFERKLKHDIEHKTKH